MANGEYSTKPMALSLRAPLTKLALVLASGGLAACQAASGTTPAHPAAATDRSALATDDVAASPTEIPEAPAPAPAPPTLGPLPQRLVPDMLVHGAGVDAATVQKVAAMVPTNQSTVLRQGEIVLSRDDGAHPLPAAGVDPGAFRGFTPKGTAEVTAVWDAATRGELVVSHDAAARLNLPLGGNVNVVEPSGAVTPFRIGAFADTGLAGVDVVVAPAVADRLALPAPNAVIVAAGSTAVTALAKAAKQSVPAGAVVDLLNHPVVSGRAFMNGGDAAKAFGVLPYKQYPDGTIVPEPAWVSASIVRATVPILGRVTCHRLMVPQLAGALQDIVNAGLADLIHPDQYQGCYVPKLIEDSNSISMHTWGLAVDLNVPTNQRGTHGDMDPRVVAIFKSWGFRWGGEYVHAPPDPMHFELIALVRR